MIIEQLPSNPKQLLNNYTTICYNIYNPQTIIINLLQYYQPYAIPPICHNITNSHQSATDLQYQPIRYSISPQPIYYNIYNPKQPLTNPQQLQPIPTQSNTAFTNPSPQNVLRETF